MGQILPTYRLPDSTHTCPEPIRQLEPGPRTGAVSSPLRVLATSQISLTDCRGKAHLHYLLQDKELGGPQAILLLAWPYAIML